MKHFWRIIFQNSNKIKLIYKAYRENKLNKFINWSKLGKQMILRDKNMI